MDSGADDNFIDSTLVQQALIPVETLDVPRTVNAVDGRRLAVVTRRTLPVTLTISDNHREVIQVFVIPSPCSLVVLGLPWLRLHNPHIDWTAATISSWRPFCHTHCFRSVVPSEGAKRPPTAKSPDLSLEPPAYHDLSTVFCKERALSLPPHRPYDCGIDLLPGATLPSSRLYNLSHPKREAMEEYINSSKAAGLICSSSSPLGAGFFFLGKKDGTLRPCIDYRGLNEITIKNKYPLPLIELSFEPLCHARVFSKLDLRNAYHLVRIRRGDEWKTTFKTPLGHFKYLVMPSRLSNAPAIFHALINDLLRDMLNHFVFVF